MAVSVRGDQRGHTMGDFLYTTLQTLHNTRKTVLYAPCAHCLPEPLVINKSINEKTHKDL